MSRFQIHLLQTTLLHSFDISQLAPPFVFVNILTVSDLLKQFSVSDLEENKLHICFISKIKTQRRTNEKPFTTYKWQRSWDVARVLAHRLVHWLARMLVVFLHHSNSGALVVAAGALQWNVLQMVVHPHFLFFLLLGIVALFCLLVALNILWNDNRGRLYDHFKLLINSTALKNSLEKSLVANKATELGSAKEVWWYNIYWFTPSL